MRKNVLFTGGIGDILAIDAHWTVADKNNIETIHWATRQGRVLIPLFQSLDNYKNADHIDHWRYDRTDLWSYVHDQQAREDGCHLPSDLYDASIWREFARIHRRELTFQGSSFLGKPLASIDHLPLPERYAVVVAYTPSNFDAHRKIRDFEQEDWLNTLTWLDHVDLTGVVINSPCADPVPSHPRLIDMTGRTTLAEAMEVVKRGNAYVGIDSWASIFAAMKLPPDRLNVLSRNTHLYGSLLAYYPTQRPPYAFVAREIRFRNWWSS